MSIQNWRKKERLCPKPLGISPPLAEKYWENNSLLRHHFPAFSHHSCSIISPSFHHHVPSFHHHFSAIVPYFPHVHCHQTWAIPSILLRCGERSPSPCSPLHSVLSLGGLPLRKIMENPPALRWFSHPPWPLRGCSMFSCFPWHRTLHVSWVFSTLFFLHAVDGALF